MSVPYNADTTRICVQCKHHRCESRDQQIDQPDGSIDIIEGPEHYFCTNPPAGFPRHVDPVTGEQQGRYHVIDLQKSDAVWWPSCHVVNHAGTCSHWQEQP